MEVLQPQPWRSVSSHDNVTDEQTFLVIRSSDLQHHARETPVEKNLHPDSEVSSLLITEGCVYKSPRPGATVYTGKSLLITSPVSSLSS